MCIHSLGLYVPFLQYIFLSLKMSFCSHRHRSTKLWIRFGC
uniref:Uncharacterized protein n=1 Tax=Arundo donax TaxID=35708 RepID=A0A0A9E4K8_ARUDO